MEFSLLKQVKDSKDICPIHKINLVQFNDKAPFCTMCQREKIDREHEQRVYNLTKKEHYRRTAEMLSKDSILGDPTLSRANFNTYKPDNQESLDALKRTKLIATEYINRNNEFNTILTGVPGVGKSHLAMSILKEVNNNFDPVGSCLFVSVSELLMLIKDSFNNPMSRYTEMNMLELLRRADLLVLDDFGSESSFQRVSNESSEFNQRFLFNVLNSRNRTIITTNLSMAEMRSIYNPKIVSRLHRGIEGHIIKFTEQTKDKRNKF